jgi:hypothetical protein
MDADRWERKRQRWETRSERRRARAKYPGRHLFSGVLLVVIGGVFLLGNMGFVDPHEVFQFWPIMLIGLGGFLLWRNSMKRSSGQFVSDEPPPPPGTAGPGPASVADSAAYATPQDPPTSSNSVLSAMAILGGVERRNNCQDFRGGDVTAIMGGCHIDLRAASITKPHEPVLEVFALWGGIEIRVPPDWTVISKVDPILGGFEDHTQSPKDETKRFVVHGTAVMGGIEVRN